jgi:hypothetical protein
LRTINLSLNQISKISFSGNFDNLNELILDQNKIRDIGFLECLANLRCVNFQLNQISDISILKKLKNLQTVELRGNPIKNLKPLKWHIIEKKIDIIWDLDWNRDWYLETKGIVITPKTFTRPPVIIIKSGRKAWEKWFAENE